MSERSSAPDGVYCRAAAAAAAGDDDDDQDDSHASRDEAVKCSRARHADVTATDKLRSSVQSR